MAKSKKTIPIYWVTVGLILIFYNQIVSFLASFGLKEIWQANIAILVLIVALAYFFTPYIETILRGKQYHA